MSARKQYKVPVYLHRADIPVWDTAPEVTAQWLRQTVPPVAHPDIYWEEGTVVTLAHTLEHHTYTRVIRLEVFALSETRCAFTGDTLFAGSIRWNDFPLSSPEDMQASLQRLPNAARGSPRIYPGHGGRVPSERMQDQPILHLSVISHI